MKDKATQLRFDLEQQILDCWNVTNDIRYVTEYVLDAPVDSTSRDDKISNMLLGMEELYNVKFQKLFDTFEKMLEEEWFYEYK